MTAAALYSSDPQAYQRRIRAWTLYDWANSAFATTILAAVLPIYYSQVAGATLPSEAVATSYWSLTLSIALLITAILSPILGTISDIMRGKKRFLSIFVGIGVVGTAALIFVGTGDWFLASIVMLVARIGFTGANTFYDALLPHVARSEDQDRVSTRGYALGYLGGGLLLAINVVLIFQLGFAEGARWSFLSVALWWALFSIPLFRQVPEPPAATADVHSGLRVVGASFKRIIETLHDMRHYRELFKFLIAFLIYNDAIGTIIGVAAIYGAELGFGATDLILALLLVQFAGIPFSLIFGSLPGKDNPRRPFFLAFILFNMVTLPLLGMVGADMLPQNITGILLPPYETVGDAAGTGVYGIGSGPIQLRGDWQAVEIPAEQLGAEEDIVYAIGSDEAEEVIFVFNGDALTLTYGIGPNQGIWAVLLDGEPFLEDGAPVVIDAFSPTVRYGETLTISAYRERVSESRLRSIITEPDPGRHEIVLSNTGTAHPESIGQGFGLQQIEVLAPVSESSLLTILGVIFGLQLIGLVFAYVVGQHIVKVLAATLNTKRSIILSLIIYSVIAVWGYFIRSTLEFWMLAWMVAIVQGGSQALSRSLYASLSPASKSGEFFGIFGVMEKFSAFIGPLIFAFAAATLGSSRPAILALIAFFIIGGFLLSRVDVAAGHKIAQAEDSAALGKAS